VDCQLKNKTTENRLHTEAPKKIIIIFSQLEAGHFFFRSYFIRAIIILQA
jgi:hypothetical protein